MLSEKKPPRFVPTLTEVVTAGRPQPAVSRAKPEMDTAIPVDFLPDDGVYAQILTAAEQYLAQRMPELVAQHMAACEMELRQELQTMIKKVVAGDV